jgi:predicted HTH transcriptional regulator
MEEVVDAGAACIRQQQNWPVNTSETQRINHTAMLKFPFYTYRRRQSVILFLNPTFKAQNWPCKSRTQIKSEKMQRAIQWQSLIGTNGIETRADLARFLGISRARITKVLARLSTAMVL